MDSELDKDELALRQKWLESAKNVKGDRQKAGRLAMTSRNSLIRGLRFRYIFLCCIALTGPIWLLFLARLMSLSPLLCVCYTFFCAVAGMLSLFAWYRISQIPGFMALPLIEAQRRILSIVQLRRRIKYIDMAMGLPVIMMLFYEIGAAHDKSMIVGGIVGGIIGLTIGLIIDLKNRRQMKTLTKLFNDL